jgi:hypothetical protein
MRRKVIQGDRGNIARAARAGANDTGFVGQEPVHDDQHPFIIGVYDVASPDGHSSPLNEPGFNKLNCKNGTTDSMFF